MKSFRWSLIVVLAIMFVVSMASQAWLAEKDLKPMIKKPMMRTYSCPQGWEKVLDYGADGFKCEPKVPASISCPQGTNFYKKICQDKPGCVCELGCIKVS